MAETFDYAKTLAVAEKLITKFGRAVTILTNQVSGPPHNPTVTWAEASAIGVILDYRDRDIDGTVIKQSDRKVLLRASDIDTTPAMGDKIEVDSVAYNIVHLKELNPAGTALLFEAQVRK